MKTNSKAASSSDWPDLYQEPTLECDLVMEGGIASGVVYPPAILELAKKYRLRGIGGASAGAIAAATAAAAEYGRTNDKAGAGFRGLLALSKQLEDGGFINDLFQPSRPTEALYRTLTDLHESAAKDSTKSKPGLLVWLDRIARILQKRARFGFSIGLLAGMATIAPLQQPARAEKFFQVEAPGPPGALRVTTEI